MAEKTFTLEALRKMSKSDLVNLAKSLHIVVSGLTKPEIIDKIISTGQTPQTVIEDRLISVGDTHELEIDEGEITIPLDPNITTDVALDRDWKVKLEFMRLVAEMRQRELDHEERERERERDRARDLELARMQHEYHMAELQTTQFPIPNDQEKSFKVEVAAKLLPKLGSDQELDFYLVTFKKIAMLNKWPKECWQNSMRPQSKIMIN